jgi:hypothetical protein
LPEGRFGTAINDVLNQCEALLLHASDGRFAIDNNFSEQTLRRRAI